MRQTVASMAADLSELAASQLADYDARRPGMIFAAPGLELTIAEAYEVQRRMAALRQRRGEAVAGYKVGCRSEAVQRQLGLSEPVFGRVFESEVYRSGVSLDATRFDGLAIEGEFAFRMAIDLPDPAALLTHPKTAIASAFAVIELHNYVHRAPPVQRAQELIVNNAMQAGVVVPPDEGKLRDPEGVFDGVISVIRNGGLLGAAAGRTLPGGPLESLIWLVHRLKEIGVTPSAGQIVLSGSPLPLYRVFPGDHIEVKCSCSADVVLTIADRDRD
jgi:2-keto-4-pentenoate hydratase